MSLESSFETSTFWKVFADFGGSEVTGSLLNMIRKFDFSEEKGMQANAMPAWDQVSELNKLLSSLPTPKP